MIYPVHGFSVKSSITCVALHKTFHCDKDKLTPYLVGIVSVSQNLRSTLLLPFHSVSSAYLPPPRGTLIGMFNAWVWSLATAKASCTRSPWVWSLATAKASCTRSPWVIRVNGMFNAWVWSFALPDISKEVLVSALSSLLFIERRLCIDGVDWLFLFCILLSDWFFFPVIWLDNRPTMGTSDWSDFLVVDWLDTSQSFYHPIIGCPDVTGSIWILCTIGLREHIQYIQSTCIHSTVFKHSWYDSVVYCYTIHLEMNSSPINIYIYSKAIFF